MNLLETYCLVCKENAINNNIEKIKNNGRLMIRSNCQIYFTRKWITR